MYQIVKRRKPKPPQAVVRDAEAAEGAALASPVADRAVDLQRLRVVRDGLLVLPQAVVRVAERSGN